jgi:glycosyltransferase involved in cell wall biosynthesis
MRIAFIHQNMPAQYKHLAAHFAADSANQCVFISKRKNFPMPNVHRVLYETTREPTKGIHHYLRLCEDQVLHGQAVFRKLLELKQKGFVPDIILCHPGWGEGLFLKDAYPNVPLFTFCEYYYNAHGADMDFDPERQVGYDDYCRIRMKNTTMLHNLQACDWGLSPTRWQWSQHPENYRHKISIVHDGIDTDVCRPDPNAEFELPNGRTLRQGDEVVTYVVRNLEPFRGFPTFMHAAEQICRRRPETQIIIVGGDEISYGSGLRDGRTYREKLLSEVTLDESRVHFLGRVPYPKFLQILQVSAVHVYLTYPFVLSWSMLEAMSSGCLVVGSSTPPVEEVIEDGVNGLLVDFFSPQEIADRVDEVLDTPGRMQHLRDAARQTILDRYDLQTVCLPAQLRIIDDLLNGRTPELEPVGVPAAV